jgi:hypothetical protein
MAYVLPGPTHPAVPPRQPERYTQASHYDNIGHFTAEPRSMRCVYFALREIITHLVHMYVQMNTCRVVAAMPQINLPSNPHQQ